MMQVQGPWAGYALKAQNTLGAWGMQTCSADAADLGEEVADRCLHVQQNPIGHAPQCRVLEAGILAQYHLWDILTANTAYRRQAEDQALCTLAHQWHQCSNLCASAVVADGDAWCPAHVTLRSLHHLPRTGWARKQGAPPAPGQHSGACDRGLRPQTLAACPATALSMWPAFPAV